MNNVLGDALQKAMNAKKNDFSSFVWKGEKRKEGDKYVQDSIRIVDMNPEQLRKCYEHCEKMSHNDDPKNLKEIILKLMIVLLQKLLPIFLLNLETLIFQM